MAGRLVSAEAIVSALRERKDRGELARVREAVRQASEIPAGRRRHHPPGSARQRSPAGCKASAPSAASSSPGPRRPAVGSSSGPDTPGRALRAGARPRGAGAPGHHRLRRARGHYCSDLQRTFLRAAAGATGIPGSAKGFEVIRPGHRPGQGGESSRSAGGAGGTPSPARSSPPPATSRSHGSATRWALPPRRNGACSVPAWEKVRRPSPSGSWPPA